MTDLGYNMFWNARCQNVVKKRKYFSVNRKNNIRYALNGKKIVSLHHINSSFC